MKQHNLTMANHQQQHVCPAHRHTCMESGTICKVLLFFMNCNLLRFKQDTYSVYAQVLNPVTYLLQTGDQTRILTPFLSLSKYSNNMATKVDNVNSAHCKIQSIPCNIYIQLFSCDLYFAILFYFCNCTGPI